MTPSGVERWAQLSACRTYRYTLGRRWSAELPRLLMVLLQPSTADAERDDPTNRRGMGFARDAGFGSLVFVNLFALRSPDPRTLRAARDPVGLDADRAERLATALEGVA